MIIQEDDVKSVLRKYKTVDSWLLASYGMNLYRGCAHNCVYCDGRSEKYNVDADFGTAVTVKINATSLLERELDPSRKRVPSSGDTGSNASSSQVERNTITLRLRIVFPFEGLGTSFFYRWET